MTGPAAQRLRVAWRSVLAMALLIAGAAVGWRVLVPAGLPFLSAEEGANWIRRDRPYHLKGFVAGEGRTRFRGRFEVPGDARRSTIVVGALGRASVAIDDAVVGTTEPQNGGPLERGRFPLPDGIAPGPHTLAIAVDNPRGPAVLLARGEAIDLGTDVTWEARLGGEPWRPVALASTRARPPLVDRFPSVASAVRSRAPTLVAIFGVALAASFFAQRRGGAAARWRRLVRSPTAWRIALLGAWSILLVNDALRLPAGLGFDAMDHLDQVRWIAYHGRLPHPLEGWQTFQAPLFYVIAAPLDALFRAFASPEGAARLLRILPLACGLLQVEIGYRAARRAFPNRGELHVVGAVVAGFTPMNIVMAQYVGNEPLAAVLSGLAIVATLRLIREPGRARRAGPLVVLGALAGLAVLAKVTTLLLLPPIVAAAAWSARRAGEGPVAPAAAPALVAGTTAVVSGWFFVRNVLLAGTPLVLSSANRSWWQDPGYRVAAHFIEFGRALVQPVFAGTASVWDGLWSSLWLDGQLSSIIVFEHRPPWNYDFVLAGAWLGFIPAVAVAVGLVVGLRRHGPERAAIAFAAASLALYTAAIVHQTLLVPYYSVAKATYMLGLLPLIGLLAAAGVSALGQRPWAKAFVHAALACWAVCAWIAYFVVDTVPPLSLG